MRFLGILKNAFFVFLGLNFLRIDPKRFAELCARAVIMIVLEELILEFLTFFMFS